MIGIVHSVRTLAQAAGRGKPRETHGPISTRQPQFHREIGGFQQLRSSHFHALVVTRQQDPARTSLVKSASSGNTLTGGVRLRPWDNGNHEGTYQSYAILPLCDIHQRLVLADIERCPCLHLRFSLDMHACHKRASGQQREQNGLEQSPNVPHAPISCIHSLTAA